MRTKFLRICPYGKKYLEKQVAECICEIRWISAAAVLLVCLWNSIWKESSGLYLLESLFLAVYLVSAEVPAYKLQEKENMVYRELLLYLSRVKHRYMACHHIPNAVLEASEHMNYEIQCLAGELYRVLMESNRKEKIREYVTCHRSNRFLKLFLVQAYEASEKGNIIFTDESSLFSENVEHLRLELMEELHRRKRRAHDFAGYTFVSAAPFFLMPVFKQWGLDFAPELDFFYAGTGILLELVTFCTTIVVYGMIGRAKEIAFDVDAAEPEVWNMEWFYKIPVVAAMVSYLERTEGAFSRMVRRLLLLTGRRTTFGRTAVKMTGIAVCVFVLLTAFSVDLHRRERQLLLMQMEEMGAILQNGSKNMETMAAQEIRDTMLQYQNARITAWEVLWCLMGGMIVGALPLLRLWFQLQASRAEAVQEVRQFQSIIIMERRLQGMTIVGLLEDMEVFSKNFRHILRKCINSYGAGPTNALLQLKEEGGSLQEGFAELADAFLSVDEVGIALAFAEVESNRRLLEKMTQLEAEISMEQKKDNADLLARIPMVLAVGVYFILPFFVHSLLGVAEVFEMLEELQM